MNTTDSHKSGLYISFFEDKDGKLAVIEKPNLPILVWLGTLVFGIIANGKLLDMLNILGFGALFTWAWLELFEGRSYFRRTLGLVVLLVSITNRIK